MRFSPAPEAADRPLSFGVRPAEKMTVAAVIRVLRDKEGERSLCTPLTQEGAVFQLRPNVPKEIGCIYWRTTAEPCTSVLLPWYLGINGTPPGSFRDVDIPTHLSLDHHFQPPQGTFDPDPRLAWWTFKTLQDTLHEDYASRTPVARSVWKPFEDRLLQDQAATEQAALRIWKTDQTAARKYLTNYGADLALEARLEAEKLIERFRREGSSPGKPGG